MMKIEKSPYSNTDGKVQKVIIPVHFTKQKEAGIYFSFGMVFKSTYSQAYWDSIGSYVDASMDSILY